MGRTSTSGIPPPRPLSDLSVKRMREPERETVPEYADLQSSIGRLERRDWELWSIALLLFTVFAAGLLTYFYAETSEEGAISPFAIRFSWLALFGLIVVVVLLNVYLIDRKRSLDRLRRRYVLQAQELHKERELGVRDPLTQMYNRRFFDEIVPKEAHRCYRMDRPLSFLLVDLDNFKEVNQRLGHFVGDQVLQAVAAVLRETLRTSDFVFRFGGDEFLVVLPETAAENAAVVEARLHQRLSQQRDVRDRIGRPLTVTIGRATCGRGDDLVSVIDHAERAVETIRASRAAAKR